MDLFSITSIFLIASRFFTTSFSVVSFGGAIGNGRVVRRLLSGLVRLHPVGEQVAGRFDGIPTLLSRKNIAILVGLRCGHPSIRSVLPVLASLPLEELFEGFYGEGLVRLSWCQRLNFRLSHAAVFGECRVGAWLSRRLEDLKTRSVSTGCQ